MLGLQSWWERKWEMKEESVTRPCIGGEAEPLRGAREPSLSPGVPVHACGHSLQTSGLLAASSLTEHSLPASGWVPPSGWGQEPRGGSRGVPWLCLLSARPGPRALQGAVSPYP